MTVEGSPTGASPARKRGTIYDIARVAGVSHQTVSRYVRGFAVRADTVARIEKALGELEYRPNLAARDLTTGRRHRIGALTHEIDMVGPSRTLRGATRTARDAGYLLDVVTLDASDEASIASALDLLTQHDLAGILALASTDEMRRAFEATDFGVPALIAAEEDEPDLPGDAGVYDRAMGDLVEQLADLGHRRFLHIGGPTTWSAARNRALAYRRAVAARDLHSMGVVLGDWSARSGHDALKGLSDGELPTAVIAANDQMALGAILALTERGLRVPDDVTVTGIDDIPEAAFFSPPLTTLAVDHAAHGRLAALRLLGVIEGTPTTTDVARPVELIVRSSSGPARSQP